MRVTPNWVEQAIADAIRQGSVAFIAVVPVASELLHDAAFPIDEVIGKQAADSVAAQVREWQQENVA